MYSKLLLLLAILPFSLSAQVVEGKVSQASGEGLVGANVVWLGSLNGVSTDKLGHFEISKAGVTDLRLVVSFVGFQADTVPVSNKTFVEVVLQASNLLDQAVIEGGESDSYISKTDPIKTEVISQGELRKAACCDLAGCFETQASVQPTTTNVITNAKELRILGLSGVYNQVLLDGFPQVQGLTYTYGISTIPGTLIEKIHVSKGANSVVQGYESISGQINVQLKDPDNTDTLLVRSYVNSFSESRFDVNLAHPMGEWSTLLSIHASLPGGRFDIDDDTFLDIPLLTRYAVFNKWKFHDKKEWGVYSELGGRVVKEERIGGQLDFNPDWDKGTTHQYGQVVQFIQSEAFAEVGWRRDDYFVVSLMTSAFAHSQDSWFGSAQYQGDQKNAYANLHGELYWNEDHLLKAGASYRYVDRLESISFNDTLNRTYGGDYTKHEEVPGFFVENAFHWQNDRFILITGLRADQHNVYGGYLTPRGLFKYQVAENTALRISVGKGWRTVNVFSENVNLLASSREVVMADDLQPEEAVNYGGNFTHKMYRENWNVELSVDFYRTAFSNQIFPDYDREVGMAFVENFTGQSVSNGFQSQLHFKVGERWGIKLAYNYLDVYRVNEGARRTLPFIPKHTVKSALFFEPKSEKWHANMNVQWYGRQRLANTASNPEEFQVASHSNPYTLVNIQLGKVWEHLELFVGCENLLGFRKYRPILGWQDPFGPYFDTSTVWGPTRIREFFVSVRCSI